MNNPMSRRELIVAVVMGTEKFLKDSYWEQQSWKMILAEDLS